VLADLVTGGVPDDGGGHHHGAQQHHVGVAQAGRDAPDDGRCLAGNDETDKDGVLGEHENRHHQVHPDR
jgi:hypothetical protein